MGKSLRRKVTVGMLLFFPRPNTSLLFTSSMLWSDDCKNMEEYYKKCVGVPLPLLPTVLGLKLAVDLELGSKYVHVRLRLSTQIVLVHKFSYVVGVPSRVMVRACGSRSSSLNPSSSGLLCP